MKSPVLLRLLPISLVLAGFLPCKGQLKPIYSKADCLKLYNIDYCYEKKQYDSSIIYIYALQHSGEYFKKDNRLLVQLFKCFTAKQMTDSAFFYLELAMKQGYVPTQDYNNYYKEADLLIFDKNRNERIKAHLQKNAGPPQLNYDLIAHIKQLGEYDQKVRRGTDLEKIKTDSVYAKKATAQMREADSINTIAAKNIIQQYGWPGYSVIGKDGDISLWAIVQHADRDVVFQEQVLELMAASILINNTSKRQYAYLYDRICVNRELPQLFGTQVKDSDAGHVEFHTLQDSINVDYYRHAFEMPKLEEYKKQFMQHYYRK